MMNYVIDKSAQSWNKRYTEDITAYQFPFNVACIGWLDTGMRISEYQ